MSLRMLELCLLLLTRLPACLSRLSVSVLFWRLHKVLMSRRVRNVCRQRLVLVRRRCRNEVGLAGKTGFHWRRRPEASICLRRVHSVALRRKCISPVLCIAAWKSHISLVKHKHALFSAETAKQRPLSNWHDMWYWKGSYLLK